MQSRSAWLRTSGVVQVISDTQGRDLKVHQDVMGPGPGLSLKVIDRARAGLGVD